MKRFLLGLLLLGAAINAMEDSAEKKQAAATLMSLSSDSLVGTQTNQLIAPMPIDVTNDSYLASNVSNTVSKKRSNPDGANVSINKKQKTDKKIKHYNSEHFEEKEVNGINLFICKYCKNYGATSKGTANKHMARIHRNVDKFKCNACPSAFPTQGELSDHTIRKHSEIGRKDSEKDMREFYCHKCDYVGEYWPTFTFHNHKKHGIILKLEEQKKYCQKA